jgi:hypothetical protein
MNLKCKVIFDINKQSKTWQPIAVSREGGSIAHHRLQKFGQLSELQSPCPETITTTSVAREKLKMLMSKTDTQTHTHTHTHTHDSDTQTSETPEQKDALETSRALLEFRLQEGKQHSEMQVEECVLTNERVQVSLSSIPGYRSGDSFLWTCRADFPQYTLSLSLSLSLSLTHTHTHTHTHSRGFTKR